MNNLIQIAIVDDMQSDLEKIRAMLLNYADEHKRRWQIDLFPCGEDLLQAFSQTPSGWGSSELEDVVKKLYPEAYACAEATAGYLSRQSGRQIPREEQAHLAICIRRACIS